MNDKPIISLSTSYLQNKFPQDGYAMICKAIEMGFEYVELGHSTTMHSMEGIIKAVDEGIIKISSLHNFCPIPPFAKGACPNLFSPSTKSKIESNQWLRHTKTTVDFAKLFNAKAIVCHCGAMTYFIAPPDRHIQKFEENNENIDYIEDKNYTKIVEKFKKRSQKRTERRNYKYLAKNIEEISNYAKDIDIFFGIENRENPTELPLDWNFENAMSLLEGTKAKTWHDVGHSMIKQLKGFGSIIDLLERTHNNLIGWHLHDCSNEGKDHIAVGQGCINFKEISRFFDKSNHIFTLELNHKVETQDAIDSLKRVQDLF